MYKKEDGINTVMWGMGHKFDPTEQNSREVVWICRYGANNLKESQATSMPNQSDM